MYAKTLTGREFASFNIEMARMCKSYVCLVHGGFAEDRLHGCITYPIDTLAAKDMTRMDVRRREEKNDPMKKSYLANLEKKQTGCVRTAADWAGLNRMVDFFEYFTVFLAHTVGCFGVFVLC